MGGQVRIRIRHKRWIGPYFDYLLVSRDEMRQILDGTGWRVKAFFDLGPVGRSFIYSAVIIKE
jgi:hypothetical protein